MIMPLYEYNWVPRSYRIDRLVMSMDAQVKSPLCQGEEKTDVDIQR
jgi:hypothetical protein